MSSVVLGHGVVYLSVDDKAYNAGMARAEARLTRLASMWSSTTFATAGINAATSSLHRFSAAAALASIRVNALAASYRALHRAMGSLGGTSSAAGILRGLGGGIASIIGGIGRGFGSAFAGLLGGLGWTLGRTASGFGVGLGSAIRGTGSVIRGMGGAFKSVAGGFGTLMVASMRTVGLAVHTALAPFRMVGGMLGGGGRLLGLGGLAGGVGVGAGLFAAGHAAIEMESQILNLKRITEATDAEARKLKKDLQGIIGGMPGVKKENVFHIASTAAKMGVGIDELPMFTRDISKMSVVLEDIPIEEAVQKIGRLLTVFEMGHDQALGFASALNRLDIASTASARDILDITTRFAGMMHVFRQSPAQAMGMATALRQAGVPLETAGTATGQILGRMSSRRDMGQFARIAGIEPKKFKDMMNNDFIGAFTAVLVGLKKIGEGAQGPTKLSQAMDKLHLDGQRVRGAFMQMIPAADEMAKYIGLATREFQTLDSVNSGYEQKAKSTAAQIELVRNNFWLAAEAIGERMLPMTRKIAEALLLLADHIRDVAAGDLGATFERWASQVGDFAAKFVLAFASLPAYFRIAKSFAEDFAYGLELSLGRAWRAWATFNEDARKVGKNLAINFAIAGSNIGALLTNLGVGLVKVGWSIAYPIGHAIARGLLQGLLDALPAARIPDAVLDAMGGPGMIVKALRMPGGLDAIVGKTPPIVPDVAGLNAQALGKGMLPFQAMPKLNAPDLMGMFAGIFQPGMVFRAGQMNLINAKERELMEIRRKAADEAEREARAKREKNKPAPKDERKPEKAVKDLNERKEAARQKEIAHLQQNNWLRALEGLPPLPLPKRLRNGPGGVPGLFPGGRPAPAPGEAPRQGPAPKLDRFGREIPRQDRNQPAARRDKPMLFGQPIIDPIPAPEKPDRVGEPPARQGGKSILSRPRDPKDGPLFNPNRLRPTVPLVPDWNVPGAGAQAGGNMAENQFLREKSLRDRLQERRKITDDENARTMAKWRRDNARRREEGEELLPRPRLMQLPDDMPEPRRPRGMAPEAGPGFRPGPVGVDERVPGVDRDPQAWNRNDFKGVDRATERGQPIQEVVAALDKTEQEANRLLQENSRMMGENNALLNRLLRDGVAPRFSGA